jgi:hypothetical protein
VDIPCSSPSFHTLAKCVTMLVSVGHMHKSLAEQWPSTTDREFTTLLILSCACYKKSSFAAWRAHS